MGLALRRGIEALALICVGAAALHALMLPGEAWLATLLPPLAAVAVLALSLWARAKGAESFPAVWKLFCGLYIGLWIFVRLTRAGILRWPLATGDGLASTLALLLSHVTLVALPLACALWAVGPMLPTHYVKRGLHTRAWPPLLAGVLATWLWPAYLLATQRDIHLAYWPLLLAIHAIKGLLTGVGEEMCYRGLLLPVAAARYGARWALVCQAGLYAAFHLHLGPVVFSQAGFVAVVFALGLAFGAVTLRTRGIGWVCLAHAGLGVGVEWTNLFANS